jgi:hypothetical protein
VGGLIGLAVPPFQVIERGFYKSSAGVFLASAVLFLGGKIALAARAGGVDGFGAVEIALWLGFVAAMTAYLASLWGDSGIRRSRSYTLALALGLVALAVSAEASRLGPLLSLATLLYPLAALAGALALGAVATGMLLGHWYLIDLGLSIVPLRRIFRFYVTALLVQLGVIVLTLVVMGLGSSGSAAVAALLRDHGVLLACRILLGPGAGLGIGWLIHRTLQIPQTMAATGLFYVAILAVMVGEMLGKLILFRTSLPL